ncbi:hypothetical protein LF048_003580, partial [Vibrio cholerae]|nr:hypothetical protein [Vibrio cholerae]EJL6695763.1 hypothetical protein [Vibrio cholerae]
FVAALTFYAKCFATCEGRKVKLEKKNLDDDFQKKHQLVIDLRNNFAAHSGAEKVEKVKVVLALDTKRRKGAVPYFTRELGQPDSYTLENIADFRCLVEHVKSLVDEKINTLKKKYYKTTLFQKVETTGTTKLNKRLKRDCQRVAFPVPLSRCGFGCCV